MKSMKTVPAWLLSCALLTTSLGIASCVTVNVNFPESAVQKATDDYVRDLYRAKETRKSTDAPAAAPSAAAQPQAALTEWLIASARADDEVFRVTTPASLKIRERLAARLGDVLEQKRAGVLGETNDGTLVIHEPGKLKKLLAKKVEKLVADENADRAELYAEVMRANALPPARLPNVKRSFARSFQAESPSGTWVQDTDGKWAQKP
jgi:uncharacterized protein YdbL (DUF1318 family)